MFGLYLDNYYPNLSVTEMIKLDSEWRSQAWFPYDRLDGPDRPSRFK